MNRIQQLYHALLKAYGKQGWWPMLSMAGKEGFDSRGYHKGDYSWPKTEEQKFEIALGAILTQNTSWVQTEKALMNLNRLGLMNPHSVASAKASSLASAIKPSGFFNEKAKKIKAFAKFYLQLEGANPTRQQLLSVWGIGPETADSILLYAFKVPTFVVDAYTRRILYALESITAATTYEEVKELFETSIKPTAESVATYQEYHALLVEHAKRYYKKKEDYQKCPLYIEHVKKRKN